MTFEELGLSPELLQAVREQGYTRPSPVQAQAIPAILTERDVMAAAQTGTGKTAAFTLPVLQRLHKNGPLMPHRTRALVLTPTRELAAQVAESVERYGACLSLSSTVIFGGVKANRQIKCLRDGVDILVATPGRLLDLHDQGEVSFQELEILVLDEADRMLDMGFIQDIRRILSLLPPRRQNLLFSATFAAPIRELATTLLHKPVIVEVAAANATAENVSQWMHPVDKKRKSALLQELVKHNDWSQVLVFVRTRQGASRLARQLESAGLAAAALHGDKSQGERVRTLAQFKQGGIRVLVATDVAARGLDITGLPQVVNFDLPNVPEDYVHRIGRTGRAGASGRAYSLVSADEIGQLNAIEQLIQRHLAREYVDGFEPDHEVPASAPLKKPRTRKRNSGRSRTGAGVVKPAARGAGKQGNKGPRRRRKPRAGSSTRKSSSR